MNEQPAKSQRGNWLVLGMLAVGVAAGSLAVAYWSGKLPWSPVPTTQPSPGTETTKLSPAQEELAAARDALSRAINARTSDPVVISEAKRLAAKYPRMPEAHVFLAQVLLYDRKFEPAYREVKTALEMEPGLAEIHLLAGTIAANLDRHQEAAAHCQKAIDLQPGEARFHVHLAQARIKLGEIERARASLNEALRLDSNRHDAYATTSDLLAAENRLAPAIAEIDKALEHTPISSRPDIVAYTRKKAKLLRQDGKPEDALAVLNMLSERELVDPEVVEDVAISWSQAGRPERAAQAFEKAQQRAPNNWRLADGAARWWIAARQFDKVTMQLRILKRLNPRLRAIVRLEEQMQRAQTMPADATQPAGIAATAPSEDE